MQKPSDGWKVHNPFYNLPKCWAVILPPFRVFLSCICSLLKMLSYTATLPKLPAEMLGNYTVTLPSFFPAVFATC